MAKRTRTGQPQELRKTKLPPPLPGGIEYFGSLGRFIDNLMGDARRGRKAREEIESMFEWDDEPLDEASPTE